MHQDNGTGNLARYVLGSSACLYIICIINKVYTEFDTLIHDKHYLLTAFHGGEKDYCKIYIYIYITAQYIIVIIDHCCLTDKIYTNLMSNLSALLNFCYNILKLEKQWHLIFPFSF